MFRSIVSLVVVSASFLVSYTLANPSYGGRMILSGNGGGGGYGGGSTSGGSYGGSSVPAAIISNHHISHYSVQSSGYIQPTTVDVPANLIPVNFIFRSASSPVYVQQKHQGTPGSYRESYSQDEPHRLVHTVTKPIMQEVREVITPFRRITQTVEPVREQIQTVVARDNGANAATVTGGGAGAGAGAGGGAAGALGGIGGGSSGSTGNGQSGYKS